MAIESVAARLSVLNIDKASEREIRTLIAALVNGVQALASKLDSDATVTDTNYKATLDTYIND